MYNLFQKLNFNALSHKRHYISVIEKIEVKIPSLPEQQQIGTFFQSLDNQISLQQQKLDTYKNLKKTLLDKMFI